MMLLIRFIHRIDEAQIELHKIITKNFKNKLGNNIK